MRVQQLRWFAVLQSQDWRSRTIHDGQGATIKLIRSVAIPRTMFWHASGSSNGSLPMRRFPQRK
eukprot:3231939-Pyramimonas_sp.AAC.1